MRFKNFTLFFLMGIFGLFTTNLFAQQDASIDPADIRWWVGEGENEAIFIVNWNEPDTALAWGYRFDGIATIETMMDAIVAADYRFSYEAESGWLYDLTFNDGVLDLSLAGMYWMYVYNGNPSWNLYNEQEVLDGDYVKWGDESCGTLLDPENYIYIWEKEVAAVYPVAEEARIDFSEIIYWIGEGENEMVFCVNWNEPNKCLAWGYRFNEESKILKEIMDDIAAADARFAYDASMGYVSDITFNDGDLHLALAGMYFMYNINGFAAWFGYDEQVIVSGDFVKWGDESCGTEIAPWTYVWTQEVEPVSVYDAVSENGVATLSVYPNPAIGETFVTIEDAGFNGVSVYDLQGRMVSTMSCVANAGEQVRLDVESLNSGVYFVRVSNDSVVRTAKLVVK